MTISQLLKPKYLLIAICIFFLVTRLYKIGEITPSVYWDEASIGYNAYSITETGKDEWGKAFPIHFRAFGEFKLPVYIYSVVPFVKFFSLNAFSVRMPAVLFSLGTVILVYLLTKKLLSSDGAGLLASFFISISPWFFIFSRTGYEATAGLMLYLLGIYLSLQIHKNYWFVFFTILSFILSAYSYNSFRIIFPITVFVLIFFLRKELLKSWKKNIAVMIISVNILILSVIPIYRLYVYDAGISRLQAVGATDAAFIKNYFLHFSPDFLFLHGDRNLRSQQADFGQLYFPELLLFPLGIFFIVKNKSKYGFLPIILLFVGPIPAAITKESPHALRAIATTPFIYMISALGVLMIKRYLKIKYLIELTFILISLIFFGNYFNAFINTYPVQSSEDWQYGYKKIFTDFQNSFSSYDQVLVSDEYAQPYIFALFYQKFDSNRFRRTVIRNSIDNWGFSTVVSFDKFKFGKIYKLLDIVKSGHSLIFASSKEKIVGLTPIGTIKFLDGTTAFWIYKY